MPRYIDAEPFGCISWEKIPEGYDDTFDSGVLWLADLLDDAPTISPDEVRGVGEWEMWEDYYGSNVYKCSVCGADWDMIEGTPQDNDFNFCPNCGARLEVSEDA